jgi:hypothetical protein
MGELVGEPASRPPLEQMAASPDLHFVKTHEMPGADEHPAICLVRDGRDALVSYAQFLLDTEQKAPKEQRSHLFARTLHDLIATNRGFGGWSANVLAWTARKAPTVFLRYEDLGSVSK